MTEPARGTTTITQVGMVVRNIEAAVRAWSDILGLPIPQIIITDTVEIAHTEYQG
jgi:methylmalonyl-CoA/ethylmalonyl-CoA epimerase